VVTPQGKYHKKISQLREGYKQKEPSPKVQLVVLSTVLVFMHTFSQSGTEKQNAVGDVALIAFYYLLRVGDYTSSGTATTTLTQAFWLKDITIRDKTTILDHSLPLATLLHRCTAAILQISKQKNGKQNQAIHHKAKHCDTCPAKALVSCIKHIHIIINSLIYYVIYIYIYIYILFIKHIHSHTSNPNTIISTYFPSRSRTGKLMRGSDINCALKAAVTKLDMKKHGFQVAQISSHSLQLGDAMALHL
jgi:hypothetical protein